MYKIKLLLVFFIVGQTQIIKLTPVEFSAKLDKNPGVLIDVRPFEDYCESRIKGAVWGGNSESLEICLAKLKPATPVFIYCEKGKRTKEVILKLSKKKIEKVYELEGGFLKWKGEGFKINIETMTDCKK